MIWLKRVLVVFLLLVFLLAVAAGIYIWRAFPQLDGDIRAAGLGAPVKVLRDGADVTHIQAQTPHDLWFSLGYVHAQERGWQLEFNRRLMHGQLSEVFGPATVETDKLLRTLGISRAAERQWQNLPAEGRDAMQAYSDGINAFYAGNPQALPPEFHILRTRPGGKSSQAWSPQDSLGWSLMMALDLGGNWGVEFARLSAAKTLATQQLWQLFPAYPGEPPASKADLAALYARLGIYRSKTPEKMPEKTTSAESGIIKKIAECARRYCTTGLFDTENAVQGSFLQLAMSSAVNDWADGLGEVEGKGSNNWVVAGSHSSSGKPLLANDPHLGLSAPAIWYFARLQAPAGKASDGSTTAAIDAIGATLPGLPFVVLGRTPQVAWSFTNTNPDVQDLYLEQLNPANPAQYRVPGKDGDPVWADFSSREEVIHIKGQPEQRLIVRESRHGPVLSDAQKSHAELLDTGKFVIALRWGALDADNQTVLAGLRANQASSVDEMLAAFSTYHSPMQSLVTADVSGRVAFKAVGKMPLRKPDNDILGIAPSPGWEARYDWAGWLPYAQTPQASQSAIEARGWLSTANQRISAPDFPIFMGQDWTVPYRHERIEKLLAGTAKHDMASMQRIQADVLSPAALRLLPFLRQALQATSAHPLAADVQKAMQGFDGNMQADQAAPLIFAAWVDELARGILGEKMGPELFKSLYGKRHFRSAIEGILEHNDSFWCGPGGCAAPSAAALERALDRLQASEGKNVNDWRWGRAHPALSAHKPFGNVPVLSRFFDVEVPTGGDTFTVNVGQYWTSDSKKPFANRQAASMRAIYDLANPENSRFIYQTGQSGLVFSSRYRDMSKAWAAVDYRPLQMNPAEVRHQLVLMP